MRYEINFTHRNEQGADIDHPSWDAVSNMPREYAIKEHAEAAILLLDAAWSEIVAHGTDGFTTAPEFRVAEIEA